MSTLINLLIAAIAVALVTAFTILLIGKIGLRDFIIGHSRIKFISELFDCDFCLSFWLSLIISIALSFIFANETLLIVPIFSTALTRYLL